MGGEGLGLAQEPTNRAQQNLQYNHRIKTSWLKAHDYNVYSEPQQSIIDKYTEKEEKPIEAVENEVSTMSQCAATTIYLGTVEGHEIIIQAGQTGLDLMLELTETENLSEETVDNIAELLASKGFDPDECSIGEGAYTPSKKEEQAYFEKIFLPQMFEQFWHTYPPKTNKAKAKAAFIKAGKKHSIAEILEGLDNYIAHKPDYQAWMHPTTFLNGERWNDEYTKGHKDFKFNNSSVHPQRPKTMGNLIADRILKLGERGYSCGFDK